ncbi:MAG: L,D-transpeptidase [Paracoccaceae bacterium]|nr:L,D-transpeptidase [Paracoccaceae bacterium]
MKALLVALLVLAAQASAEVVRVTIDLSDQRMYVSQFGTHLYSWPVSTARRGKKTPTGVFRPYLLKRMHYSTIYNNAPMPWSVFFYGNYAIHGTTEVHRLGAPASAGCVRLAPENAETLYGMIRTFGKSETRIVIRR